MTQNGTSERSCIPNLRTYGIAIPHCSLWKQIDFSRRRAAQVLAQVHHQHPGPLHIVTWTNEPKKPERLDLCEPIEKHGAWLRPLVRESFALHCGLKILFLRKEHPGKIYQGGDIDGRIKTLLDALAMPQHAEQVLQKTSTTLHPIYCLLRLF